MRKEKSKTPCPVCEKRKVANKLAQRRFREKGKAKSVKSLAGAE